MSDPHRAATEPREANGSIGSPSPYEPTRYWQGLHADVGGLAAVGDPYLPEPLNAWFYRSWARNLGRFVDVHNVRPQTVFDVGAGTGYWVDWWLRRGAREVIGCDLAASAVERLNRRHGTKFVQLDVAQSSIPGTYDLVSVMSVLLHIMDPDGFREALRNVAAAVRPGGHLLLMDPLLTGSVAPPPPALGASSQARPATAYIDPLRDAGLEVVAIKGATALCSDPIELGRWSRPLLDAYWARLHWLMNRAPRTARVTGRIAYLIDPIPLRLGLAPSTKFVLLRRPQARAGKSSTE